MRSFEDPLDDLQGEKSEALLDQRSRKSYVDTYRVPTLDGSRYSMAMNIPVPVRSHIMLGRYNNMMLAHSFMLQNIMS